MPSFCQEYGMLLRKFEKLKFELEDTIIQPESSLSLAKAKDISTNIHIKRDIIESQMEVLLSSTAETPVHN